jgi:hypothetical protein
MDLIVGDLCGSEVAVLLGNGDGTFQPAVTYSTGADGAYSVAVGDVNGDHVPDLVVAELYQNQGADSPGAVSVLLGNGDGTFQPAVVYSSGGYYAYSVAMGDLNGDGKLDLAVANAGENLKGTGSVGVLLGNGDGTFQPPVVYDSGGYGADSVAIGDVNGDGTPDLVVANLYQSGGANSSAGVLLGNGDGTFQPAVTYDSGGSFGFSVAVGDLRGKGTLDVVVADECEGNNGGCPTQNAIGVLLGNGDGTFQSAVNYPSVGWGYDAVAIGDVNGDGIPDLVVVGECQRVGPYFSCLGTGRVNVMLGNGDGTFQAPVTYSSGAPGAWSVAVEDVNGDGRPDLVVTNMNYNAEKDGTVAVLLNETYYASKTALTSSPNPSQVNQTVTFTVTITPTPPNGEVVTFYNGKMEMGTGTTTSGVASLNTSFSKAGKYTIKASYPGDAFRKASSGTVRQVVNQ